ncbi:uncharacterized protein LOC134840498 isoform X4 [Symsagittifera roscoffensis]|uniref:uncharacterized protein LOC134840498 isoform X4 n=1 Tax=Symsagittifera roscoffensis TaxID=84072 RepID=UPI00307BFB19
MSTTSVLFKGVAIGATESAFEEFVLRETGSVRPVKVRFYNPVGDHAYYQHADHKHCVADFANCMEAAGIVGFLGSKTHLEFQGKKIISVSLHKPEGHKSAIHHDQKTNGFHSEQRSNGFDRNSPRGSVSQPETEVQCQQSIEKFKLCVYNVPVEADRAHFRNFLKEQTGTEPIELFFALRSKNPNSSIKNSTLDLSIDGSKWFVTYGNDEEALQMKTLMDEGKVEYLGSKLSANYAFEKDPVLIRSKALAAIKLRNQATRTANKPHPQSNNSQILPSRPNFNNVSPQVPKQPQQQNYISGYGPGGSRTRPVSSMIRQGPQQSNDSLGGNSSMTGSSVTIVPNGQQNQSGRAPRPNSTGFSDKQAMVYLEPEVTKEDIQDIFSKFGELKYTYVTQPKPGKTHIMGFIGYKRPEGLTRMWTETNRVVNIKGTDYQVKPAFHKDDSVLEKVDKNQSHSSRPSTFSHRNQADDLGAQSASEVNCSSPSVVSESVKSTDSSEPGSKQELLATSSASNGGILRGTPALESSIASVKLPTLANMNFTDLCASSAIEVYVKKYNNHLYIIFELTDLNVAKNLQQMLNEAGQKAPTGLIDYVVSGEVVMVENEEGSGSFKRSVVRIFDIDTGLVVLEDLDSCEQFTAAVEELRPINDECVALPVSYYHGALVNCEPLPGKNDDLNDMLAEFLMGESVTEPFHVQVYRQIFNWVDFELSTEENVKEGSIPQIMIDYEMARKPQTGEDWTRNKSIDPIKISKGEVKECEVMSYVSPNELLLHVSDMIDYDTLCSVWSVAELTTVPNYAPFPMELVCVLYHDNWCRANCLSVGEDKTATLFLVDWGDLINMPFNKIRPAPDDWVRDSDTQATIQGLAIKVSMQGLYYPTKFTTEQIAKFKEICKPESTQLTLKITELNKRRRAYDGTLEVASKGDLLDICVREGIVSESSITSSASRSLPPSVAVGQSSPNERQTEPKMNGNLNGPTSSVENHQKFQQQPIAEGNMAAFYGELITTFPWEKNLRIVKYGAA